MISPLLADVIGLTGSALFIGGFAYANIAQELNKVLFNALNLGGAILLLISLWVNFNLAAFVLEAAWGAIAVVGLVVALRARKPSPVDPPDQLRFQGRGLGEGEARDYASSPLSPTLSPEGEREK